MSELNEADVRRALQNVLSQQPRASYDGDETRSYVYVPVQPQDEPILSRVIPKMIGEARPENPEVFAVSNVSFDRGIMKISFTTPAEFDQPYTPTEDDYQRAMESYVNNPRYWERVVKDMDRRKEPEVPDAPTPHGQQAAQLFFQAVAETQRDPRMVVAAVNGAESTQATFEQCMRQYETENLATGRVPTMLDNVNAMDRCTVKSSRQR